MKEELERLHKSLHTALERLAKHKEELEFATKYINSIDRANVDLNYEYAVYGQLKQIIEAQEKLVNERREEIRNYQDENFLCYVCGLDWTDCAKNAKNAQPTLQEYNNKQ